MAIAPIGDDGQAVGFAVSVTDKVEFHGKARQDYLNRDRKHQHQNGSGVCHKAEVRIPPIHIPELIAHLLPLPSNFHQGGSCVIAI